MVYPPPPNRIESYSVAPPPRGFDPLMWSDPLMGSDPILWPRWAINSNTAGSLEYSLRSCCCLERDSL
jgi:hypothetical protein